jgi:tetratricopeptide (TPR) repeat protein
VLHDFRLIVSGARNLPAPDPSPLVWQKIASEVRKSKREVMIATGHAARWRYAAAAAAGLIIIGGGLVIGLWMGRRPAVPDRGSVEFTLAKLAEAQRHYEQAIAALSEAVQSRKGGLNPELSEVFKRTLEAMDETIQVCRQLAQKDPEDLTVRAYLLSAYREKVTFLQEIVGFEGTEDAKIKTTTL